MRTTLSLPKRTVKSNAALAASREKFAHVQFDAPEQLIRSKLFGSTFVSVSLPKKHAPARILEKNTISPAYPLEYAKGEFNRPDKSEPKISLTFKWSQT